MRYAEQVQGPLRVTLRDGGTLKLAYIDGGGQPLDDPKGAYEVHGSYMHGGFACIEQDRIERVEVIATNEEVEFGNPYVPGHPRFRELEPA